ncbi:hypothetical protein HGRIS_012950 [Hohenbuehelia grisea]
MLEEEERIEQAREDAREAADRQASLQQRSAAAKEEVAGLKAATEMQRKMGKALLRGLGDSRKKAAPAEPAASSPTLDKPRTDGTPKKSVSFADAKPAATDATREGQWGDVSLAKLQAKNRPTLVNKAEKLMKMDVVERIPGPPTEPPAEDDKDSDDESVTHEVSVTADLDDNDYDNPPPFSDDESEDGEDGEAQAILEEEEFDFDTAQHHREIALEYHDKRKAMADATRSAFNAHSHEPEGSEGDYDDLHGGPIGDKPALSRFQADRLGKTYTASHSLDTILPASSTRSMQDAIRLGKLDADNRLVGEAADSESEDDKEAAQQIFELLKKGQIYNAGPNPQAASSNLAQARPQEPPHGPPPSKNPHVVDSVMERRPPNNSPTSVRQQVPSSKSQAASQATPLVPSQPVAPAILQSPSFPMIVDSPSFRPPQSRRPDRPPTVMSTTVKESAPKIDRPSLSTEAAEGKPIQKVSRFMQNRM